MSRKIPPERLMYSTGGAPGIARGDVHHLHLADRAVVDRLPHRLEVRVEPPVEPDHQRRTGRLHHFEARLHPADVEVDRLLAEDRLPARAKRSIRSACMSVGVQITTASMSPAASIASMCAPRAAVGRRDRLRRRRQASATATSARLRVAGDRAGVNLADAPGAEQAERTVMIVLALRSSSLGGAPPAQA